MIRFRTLHLIAPKALFLVLTLCLFIPSLAAGQDVVTQHNDTSRTGQNINETVLTTSNVNVNNFGKVFARTLDGKMYAQPLYVANLTINGTTHNVVFAVTMHNSVYAFDADDPNATAPLWQVNLGVNLGTPVSPQDVCTFNAVARCDALFSLGSEIGILSTPVVDTASGTIYVVTNTKNTAISPYHYHLHALDILTGAEKFNGPVEITGSVPGTAPDNILGTVTFDPLHQLNRPGLLLMNGFVYVAFGGVADLPPYHGWVFGYNAGALQQAPVVFNDTPNGDAGAIWQGGQGLLGDPLAGNIYFTSGNGMFDANTVGGADYGDSVVKLTAAGLTVADYFTPFNQGGLNGIDADLGSGGPMALPGTPFIVAIGKDCILRLIDTTANNMGMFNATTNNDVQEFQACTGFNANNPPPLTLLNQFIGGPVYWNSPNNVPMIYLWGPSDFLKSYKFTAGALVPFQTTPVSQSTMTQVAGFSSSVPLSLSANGSLAGTGIVWASTATQDPAGFVVPGILRAFDATNLSVELWNSTLNPARDGAGSYAKFSPPTIANGKVYLSTFSNQLLAYGLVHDGIVNPAPSKTSPDIGDALAVFKYVLGMTTLSDVQKTHADVAPLGSIGKPVGNGVVDLGDVISILRRVVGAVTW